MMDIPEICKNCKRNGMFYHYSEEFEKGADLERCKYKSTIRELERIANENKGLKPKCSFKEEC